GWNREAGSGKGPFPSTEKAYLSPETKPSSRRNQYPPSSLAMGIADSIFRACKTTASASGAQTVNRAAPSSKRHPRDRESIIPFACRAGWTARAIRRARPGRDRRGGSRPGNTEPGSERRGGPSAAARQRQYG